MDGSPWGILCIDAKTRLAVVVVPRVVLILVEHSDATTADVNFTRTLTRKHTVIDASLSTMIQTMTITERIMVKINIQNKEHFKAACRFAKQLGGKSRRSFIHSLHIINCFKRHTKEPKENVTLHIYPDWVDHSFGWHFTRDNIVSWGSSGMILHGFQETLSVELTSSNYPHWSIHT